MEPIMCVKGCGFFGSAENRNMCSKCYKDFIKTEVIAKSIAAVDCYSESNKIEKPASRNKDAEELSEITAKFEDLSVEKDDNKKKKKKNRCKCCNKKVGLLGFKCRCGEIFCGSHRMPELHKCDFDYKSTSVPNANPHLALVKADKLDYRI